jgi:hypothetical protein
MKPQLCTSDFIYFIDDDELYSNRVSYKLIASNCDAHDLAHQRVNGWRRVMLSLAEDLRAEVRLKLEREGAYEPETWFIVAEPGAKGSFPRPYGKLEFEYEALISF